MIWTETDAALEKTTVGSRQKFAAFCLLPASYRPSGSVREAFYLGG